ncbi:MAG: pilus assembly protein TadG-related protein [Gemmataceae bacterium]|nr:pilus assembly protein TadG-related protein [Gemmataceae bacterium]
MRLLTHKRDQRRAAVAPLVALSIIALLGFVAIALDGGLLFDSRRKSMAGADAAALAAATEMWNNNSSNAAGAAFQVAKTNGFLNDAGKGSAAGTSKVEVRLGGEKPLLYSPTVTDANGLLLTDYVEVTITYYQQRYFSAIWGANTLPVKVRAVARGLRNSSRYGIIVLDQTAEGALNVAGGGVVKIDTAVIVNSSHATTAALGQGSSGGQISAADFFVYGGITEQGGEQFIGNKHTGIPPTPDPLAYLPAVDPATLYLPPAPTKTKNADGTFTVRYKAGIYTNGLSLSGNSDTTFVLEPGIYYMDGGGFNVSGSSNLSANGVMIYNAPKKDTDVVYIAGQGKIVMTPPTTGVYTGISIFQDRNSTAPITIKGNGNAFITGAIYGASAPAFVEGNGDAAAGANNQILGSQYVTGTLRVAGNGGFRITANGGPIPRLRDIRLVE